MTALRPDWYGLGTTGVQVDALGNVLTNDVNSNGLPTVDDRSSQPDHPFTFDSKGNMTEEIYPDGNNDPIHV